MAWWHTLHKMGWTRKETTGYRERSPLQRRKFLRLRERHIRRDRQLVHVDECGVAPFAALKKYRDYHETASIDQIVKAYQ